MKQLQLAGIAGMITPIIVFAMIFGAISSWSNFDWVNNALSDLGVQWGLTANLFNSGLVLGGLLFMIFANGLHLCYGKRIPGKIGSGLFFLACVALIGIGIFNETFSPTHYIVSLMLFICLPLSLLAFAVALWQSKQRKIGVLTLALGIAASVPWLLQFSINYVPNVAIPETISGLTGAAWTMIMGYIILQREKEKVVNKFLNQKKAL